MMRLLPILAALLMTGCMEWETGSTEEFAPAPSGVFIVNEGNFQFGNASLSCYDPTAKEVENGVFQRANGFKLGDVAMSMTIRDSIGWVVVNNSHVIFAIDTETFRETGRITGFTSPRHIHFISDRKAYVTQIWDNRIAKVDPATYSITGYIECPEMEMESGSTEEMVAYGKYLFVSCFSYQNRILKIDTETDEVVGELEVGMQPSSLVLDRNGKLWTMTDGGYDGSPYGNERPSIHRIDAATLSLEKSFPLAKGDSPVALRIDGTGGTLYWINRDVWSMPVESQSLPVRPLIGYRDTRYYGLWVDPASNDIYVADAIDHQQQGVVGRYSMTGTLIDEFYVGVNPRTFCKKQ